MEAKDLYSYFLKSTGVATDSRQIEEGKLFICLRGDHFNGNKFAAEAIEKGAHLPSVDERIKHALECPCVKPLRDTSCREEFDLALTCFMKADEATRASDCADRFVALHQCMVKHSEEFKEFAEELVKHKNVEGPAQV